MERKRTMCIAHTHGAKRALCLLLCLLAFLPGCVTAKAAEPTNNQTVKAGVFYFDGYHMESEDGNLIGYGMEFLNLVSQYSHLNFSYVGYENTWEDMQTMLDNGEIDVVTSARKTPEREEKYGFSLPIGRNSTILSIRTGNTSQLSGDYATYQGITIGVVPGSSQNQTLAEFAREKGFSYQTREYPDVGQMAEDLQNGTIDAILSSSLRKAENEKTLDTLETDYFYAIVRKEDTGLLKEINYAIDQMNINEGDWSNVLFYKYYGNSAPTVLSFTERERAYIQEVAAGRKQITVTSMGDRKPYSYVENGELRGILPDYFAGLMELAGLSYETIVPNDRAEYYALADNDGVDVVIDWRQDQLKNDEFERSGFYSVAYLNTGVAMVTRKDFNGEITTLAVADLLGDIAVEKDLIGNAETLNCQTRESALQAVLDGRADATYVYTYTAQSFVNSDHTASLKYNMVGSMSFDFKIYVRSSCDHELITILNKCIGQMPSDAMNQLITAYTANAPENMSFGQYLRAHPEVVIIAALLAITTTAVIIVLYMRSRQKAALETALAEAQHANIAKTTFLNSMSHDIRTPMNAIIGFTSLAMSHIGNQEQVESYLGKILTSSKHLLSLINDILDMSRIESGKVKIEENEASLLEIMHDLKTIVQADVKAKQLSFHVDTLDVTNETIICDKLRLSQVLLNILSNAIKYTGLGGTVGVRIIQTNEAPEGYADYQFRVKDTGIGMSPEFLEHVFEPFEREQTSTVSGIQGTGLGLAITKNIVDMMNGTITVTSEEGKGSEFVVSFRFRVKKDTEIEALKEEGEDMSAQFLRGKKILLVEDNELNREIATTVLEEAGLVIDAVEDGTEVVETIQTVPAGTYDLILMDIQMPVMDGYTATRTIRAMNDPAKANIPIVAMTANAFEEDRQKALEAGMNGHVPKPIDIPGLMNALKEILVGEG